MPPVKCVPFLLHTEESVVQQASIQDFLKVNVRLVTIHQLCILISYLLNSLSAKISAFTITLHPGSISSGQRYGSPHPNPDFTLEVENVVRFASVSVLLFFGMKQSL